MTDKFTLQEKMFLPTILFFFLVMGMKTKVRDEKVCDCVIQTPAI